MERRTRQRDAIWEVICEADRPLSPQEIQADAKGRVKQLGIATVYRAIQALVAEDELVAVEIPGQAPRYERAGKQHHHHFVCRGCNRVYELEGCPLRPSVKAPDGFAVDSHEVTLFGTCASCKE